MSSVGCEATSMADVHVNATGVAPLTVEGAGTLDDKLYIHDIPAVVEPSSITATNFTFGNAQQLSYHMLDGKTMHFWWRVIFGTTSTFTASAFGITIAGSTPQLGTGNVLSGLPVGSFKISNSALTSHFYGQVILSSTGGDLRFRFVDDFGFAAENLVRQNVPLVFGNGVVFTGSAYYEVT